MERVLKFLKEVETYYLATVEGDQPRVRPFGTKNEGSAGSDGMDNLERGGGCMES